MLPSLVQRRVDQHERRGERDGCDGAEDGRKHPAVVLALALLGVLHLGHARRESITGTDWTV